jgi:hypothetical protein
MAITRSDTDQRYFNGVLQASTPVVRDITDQAIKAQLDTKVRNYLTTAATFLALASPTTAQTLAQVRLNTRAICGLIRYVIANDLLVENTDT